MNHIKTIFRKELKDVLRDRRTVYAMILAPVLIYPLLITAFTQVMRIQQEKSSEEVLHFGLCGQYLPAAVQEITSARANIEWVKEIPADSAEIANLMIDSLQAVFAFPENMEDEMDSMRQQTALVYYRATDESSSDQVFSVIQSAQNAYTQLRLKKLELDPSTVQPLVVNAIDLSSTREKIGQSLGAMVPYFFMIFCFLGCMYPAIDLGAGEKERGTMETLLASPASRLDIFLGKFGVVAVGGMVSAALALISLAVSLKLNSGSFGELPPEFTDSITSMVNPSTLLLLLLLLLPLTAFFASALMTLSISAKSFKEAQSIISPMMILVMLPTIVGFIPGLELTVSNAWIPIFNVSLASKDILAGTLELPPFIVAVVSLFVLAGLGIWISLQFFHNEKNMLPS